MLDLISLKVSPVKSVWKMLYDRENLYIHVQCRCPGAFTSPEEKQEWAKPHLSFFFSLGEGDPGQRTLRLSVNENGAVNTAILNGYISQGGSARETVLPDLKRFVRIRELQKSYVWETGIILPFAALERPMPLHGETFSFPPSIAKRTPVGSVFWNSGSFRMWIPFIPTGRNGSGRTLRKKSAVPPPGVFPLRIKCLHVIKRLNSNFLRKCAERSLTRIFWG